MPESVPSNDNPILEKKKTTYKPERPTSNEADSSSLGLLKTGYEIFQRSITEALWGVFISGISAPES